MKLFLIFLFALVVYMPSANLSAVRMQPKWGQTQEEAQRSRLNGFTMKEERLIFILKDNLKIPREKTLNLISASRVNASQTFAEAHKLLNDEELAHKVVDYFFAKAEPKNWEETLKDVDDDFSPVGSCAFTIETDYESDDGYSPVLSDIPVDADSGVYRTWKDQFENGFTKDSFEEYYKENNRLFQKYKKEGMFD